MAEFMVAADPEYAEIVWPHCGHDALGMPPGTPAALQSTAREGSRMPLQFWANTLPVKQRKVRKSPKYFLGFMFSPLGEATLAYIYSRLFDLS
jgi:hypothetical protein